MYNLSQGASEETILTSYPYNNGGGFSSFRGDISISIANTGAPNNEETSSVSKASNSSASATITITMYTVADE